MTRYTGSPVAKCPVICFPTSLSDHLNNEQSERTGSVIDPSGSLGGN